MSYVDHHPTAAQARRPHADPKRRATADLARRWPDRKNPGKVSHLWWRRCYLMKVVNVEHGGRLPDSDAGRDILRVVADAFWFGCSEPVLELQRAIPRIAPWCDIDELIDDVAESAKRCNRPLTKREAGQEIGLTYAMQVRTKAWGITPCDKTDRQLAGLRRKRRAASSRAYRARIKARRDVAQPSLVAELMAAHGIARRTAYRWIAKGGERHVPLTVSQPWQAGGIGRRTWERRRRRDANGGTSGVTGHATERSTTSTQAHETADVSHVETQAVSQHWHKPRHRQSALETTTSPPCRDDIAPSVPPTPPVVEQGLVAMDERSARAVAMAGTDGAASANNNLLTPPRRRREVLILEATPASHALATTRADSGTGCAREISFRASTKSQREAVIATAIAVDDEIADHRKSLGAQAVRRLIEQRWPVHADWTAWGIRKLILREIEARDEYRRRRERHLDAMSRQKPLATDFDRKMVAEWQRSGGIAWDDDWEPDEVEITAARSALRLEQKAEARRIRLRDARPAGVTQCDARRRRTCLIWACGNLPVEHPLRQSAASDRDADAITLRRWCGEVEALIARQARALQ